MIVDILASFRETQTCSRFLFLRSLSRRNVGVLRCRHRSEGIISHWLQGDRLHGFNFAGVLADYRHLSGAVTENVAAAGGEQGAGTLIRTAALGRFPQGAQLDGGGGGGRQVETAGWARPQNNG